MPMETNAVPDGRPYTGREIIDWLDREGQVADHLIHVGRVDDPVPYNVEFAGVTRTVYPTVGSMTVKVTKVQDFPIQTAEQLLAQFCDLWVSEQLTGSQIPVEHQAMVQVTRARTKIAVRTKRAMGNTLIPCEGGCIMTYVGNPIYLGDRGAMQVGDQQYVAVENLSDYFVWIPGDPIEIQRAFDTLTEKLNAA